MITASTIGIAAAILTTGAYIPQAYKTIKTKDTSGLSITTFSMLLLGTILWFIYGVFLNDIPLMIANGLTTLLSGTIFFIKLASIRK